MSTPATPSSPKPAGDDRNLVAVDATTATSFEDKLHLFWKNNGTAVLTLVGLVIVGILAKGGWDRLKEKQEKEVEDAYAAATTADQLKAFAASHADHTLAGLALLRVADDAYAAGKTADALAGYEKVIPVLKDSALVARAKLGRAVSKIGSGKTTDGAAELKQLADDANLPKNLRAEATYHLASLAADAGNAADVQKYTEQLMKIDIQSPYTQRAMGLRATMPAPAKPADAPKADDKKPAAGSPSVEIKLPGK